MVVAEAAVSDSIRHHHRAAGYVRVDTEPAARSYAVFTLPNEVDFVELGQDVSLYIGELPRIMGVVENIRLHTSYFEVYVSFDHLRILVDERVCAVFEYISAVHERTLPRSAIREAWWRPQGGYAAIRRGVHIVLVVERERGLFGYIYSVRSLPITIIDESLSQTAIQPSFPLDALVVTGSTADLVPGARVRLAP